MSAFGQKVSNSTQLQPKLPNVQHKEEEHLRPNINTNNEQPVKMRIQNSLLLDEKVVDEISESDGEFPNIEHPVSEPCAEPGGGVAEDDDDDFLDLLADLQEEAEEEKTIIAKPPIKKSPLKNPSKKFKSQLDVLHSALKRGKQKAKAEELRRKQDFETHSGLRMKSRLMSQKAINNRLRKAEVVKLKSLSHMHHQKLIPQGWAIIGCLASKLTRTTKKTGNKFLILKISDLNHVEVAVFVFNSEAVLKYSGFAEGSVVAIGGAKFMEKRGHDDLALSVSSANQILLLGYALDFGKCAALKRDGSPCTGVVNTNYALYCPFHTKKRFEKAASKRNDCNRSFQAKKDHYFGTNRQKNLSKGDFLHNGRLVRVNNEKKVLQKKKKNRGTIYYADMDVMCKGYKRGGTAVRNSKNLLLKKKLGLPTGTKYPKGMKLVNNPGAVTSNGATVRKGLKRKRMSAAEMRIKKNIQRKPVLGRDWGNSRATARRKSQELAMAKLGIKIREIDPNTNDFDSFKSPVKRFGGGQERKKVKLDHNIKRLPLTQLLSQVNGGSTSNLQPRVLKPSPPEKAMSKFAQQFGNIDIKSSRAKARLKRGSRFKTAADKERFEKSMAKIDSIVREEYQNEAKEKVQKIKVSFYKCLDSSCPMLGKLTRTKNPVCINKNHHLRKTWGDLYAFKCQGCGKRDTQPNSRIYKGRCPKCGKPLMKPASIYRTKTATKVNPGKELLVSSKRTEIKGY